MKTLKCTIAVIALAFFTNSSMFGQVWQGDVVVNFYEYDYTAVAPFIGIVTGNYTYHFAIKLNKEGEIQSIHWVVKDCNLHNQNGDKIICIDTGHDNLGFLWAFWNRPNEGNGFDPRIIYDIQDGWLDEYLPEFLPIEGTFVGMAFKMMVKGQKWNLFASMVQLHMNANGIITADVVKP
jgi:hypothetical protein